MNAAAAFGHREGQQCPADTEALIIGVGVEPDDFFAANATNPNNWFMP